VTVPLAKGATGHVAFFQRFIDADNLEILGGNQTRRVKLMPIHRSKIVAIKWLDRGDPEPGNSSTTQVEGSEVTAGGSAVSVTESDLLTLARTLWGEARGEPRKGIEAVANVILNRVASPRYPDTVTKVCRQPFQFSCWNRNDPNFPKLRNLTAASGDAKFTTCLAVAEAAVKGGPMHVTADTLHYHATSIAKPSWVRKSPAHRVTLREGRHIFYSGIK